MTEEQYTMSSDVAGWFTLPEDVGEIVKVTVYGRDMLELEYNEDADTDNREYSRNGVDIVSVSVIDCCGVNELVLTTDAHPEEPPLSERVTVQLTYIPKNLRL